MTESELADYTQRSRNPAEAAAYIGVSRSWLAKARITGRGPRYVKIDTKTVVYRKQDLDAWLAARVRSSTSEVAA